MHRHLLTVWNPAYASDAFEAHVRLLLEWDARRAAGTASTDDVYIWWGKVRSSNRLAPMPHLADILALDAQAAEDDDVGGETHLYLTDYRSLYVADLLGIAADDPRVDDNAHVPAYYTRGSLSCDCWFQVADIRALVHDDLEGVQSELARLRNTRYHDKPVSLYGGMTELPLLVTRPDGRQFFGEAERTLLADGALWARFDAERGAVGAMEATLREDHLGAAAWQALDAAARRFLASAEFTLREHRRDPAADLSAVVVGYAKVLEVQVNLLLREAVRDAPEPARRVKLEQRTGRVPDDLPLSLRQLGFTLGGERALIQHLCTTLVDGAWLTSTCAAVLDQFAAEARNPAAHGEVVPRDVVLRWRNRLLGVGSESVVGRLALAGRAR
jgi:hypothetical protein